MTRRLAFAVAFVAATATITSSLPAIAAKFDGNWTMSVVTTRGHCGFIGVGLGIDRGRVFATGGSFILYPIQLSGSVAASGRARINAIAGPRTAKGTGQFGRFQGSGTWAGQGPSGLCSGRWSATRS